MQRMVAMKKNRLKQVVACILAGLVSMSCLTACSGDDEPVSSAAQPAGQSQTESSDSSVEDTTSKTELTIDQILDSTVKLPTETTKDLNKATEKIVDFDDSEELSYATAGFIAGPEKLEIKDESGNVVWTCKHTEVTSFEDTPETANPVLWRNYAINSKVGLYKVKDGIYQVRGYDITNMTIIEGKTGWIIIDPMLSTECSQAALRLAQENLGQKPIMAVIVTNSNVDHYGGIKGVISESVIADRKLTVQKQIASKKTLILAPDGFTKNHVSESIYASHVKGRIRNYMMGSILKSIGATGNLGIGIGLGISSGTISYLQPTYEIQSTKEVLEIDGVKMQFQLTSDTMDSSEMNIYFQDYKVLFMSDNVGGCTSELYTTNDVQSRDGTAVAKYIMEAISLNSGNIEIVIQSHNWPHGNAEDYLKETAALYKYINDQTLLYLNSGYTEKEIVGMINIPKNFKERWYLRQCYVSLDSLVAAICDKYVGTNESNPVYLSVLEPSEYAAKIIEYMGTEDSVVARAIKDYDKGEYQWVAELMMIVIYNNPNHVQAKYLCADALEQLAYQAEAGTVRNSYLTAVYELRNGTTTTGAISTLTGTDTLRSMSTEMLFNYMSMLIDPELAGQTELNFNITVTDTNEEYALMLYNGVLLYHEGFSDSGDIEISCTKDGIISIMQNNSSAIQKNIKIIEGSIDSITTLTSFMVKLPSTFNVIEP